MYYVKALKKAPAKDISGNVVEWNIGEIKLIADADLEHFKDHPDVFLIVDNINTAPLQMSKDLGFLANGQPKGIARPCKGKGKKVIGFAAADAWSLLAGTVEGVNLTTTNDVTNLNNSTGLPTGPVCPDGTQLLKKIDVLTNGNVGIIKFITPTVINGLIGFWVYVGNPANGTIRMHVGLATAGGGGPNDYLFTNNAVFADQWNFLVIARSANPTSNTNVEAHPFGLVESIYAFAESEFVTAPLTVINVYFENMAGSTIYLANVMTGWDTKAQFVLGGDSSGAYTRDIILPKFKQYGLKGYIAETFRISTGEVTDWGAYGTTQYLDEAYAAGWDIVNHTVNHQNAVAAYPANAAIARYEATASQSWLQSLGYVRGSEFYVSPQGATNGMVIAVVKNAGFKLQRHGSHEAVQVTPFGVTTPEYIGSIDVGGNGWIFGATAPYVFNYAQIDNLRIWVDMIIKYKATAFPFWHVVRKLGDTGDGRGIPPDTVTMYKSTFDLLIDYIAAKAAQGLCTIPDGFTGFYYGSGR